MGLLKKKYVIKLKTGPATGMGEKVKQGPLQEDNMVNLSIRKVKRIREMIMALMEKITGYIKVNFFGGHIGRIKKYEEMITKEPP